MTRKTHLVGSWPGYSGAHAMDQAFRRLGPHLLRMSDGETGERSMWVTPAMEWMRANPDVVLVRDGDYQFYGDGPVYETRVGHTLDPNNLELGYYRAFERSYPAFRVLRERHGFPDVSFQVGLPAPVDLAGVTFGEDASSDAPLIAAWKQATLREIGAITAVAGDDVIFQVETVASIVATASAEPQERLDVAEHFARLIADVAAAAPVGTRFGCHTCLGDLNHQALMEMGDAGALVVLANALARAWPQGRTFEYIHAPFAAAERPGSLDPSWYEPLSELTLPSDTRFVAGFVHESLSLPQLQQILSLIEDNAGRPVDIGSTCGLGRRPSHDQAWDAMEKSAALIEHEQRDHANLREVEDKW